MSNENASVCEYASNESVLRVPSINIPVYTLCVFICLYDVRMLAWKQIAVAQLVMYRHL